MFCEWADERWRENAERWSKASYSLVQSVFDLES